MVRRAALISLSNVGVNSTPLKSKSTKGLNTLRDVIEPMSVADLENRYGTEIAEAWRTPARKRKSKPKSKSKKRRKTTLSAGEEALLKEASKLQESARKKFDISNFVKKPRYPRKKGTLKRVATKKTNLVTVNKRTTLLSLLKRIPDAKKPIATWLK